MHKNKNNKLTKNNQEDIVKEYAIFWIGNGFDDQDPNRVDRFSRACLEQAVQRYQKLKQKGKKVYFPIINSVVKDPSGQVIMKDVLKKEILEAGVDIEDIELTSTQTTGSSTDALAITRFAKKHPETKIEIYATTKSVAKYFEIMYKAVAHWVENYELNFSIYFPDQIPNLKSQLLYHLLRIFTLIVAQSKFSFMIWYNFLNWVFSKRVKGFTKTIK